MKNQENLMDVLKSLKWLIQVRPETRQTTLRPRVEKNIIKKARLAEQLTLLLRLI